MYHVGMNTLLYSNSLGINTLHDLVDQSDVAYGTIQGSSLSTILSDMTTEPYVTMHTHMIDHLVQNTSEGVERVHNSYGIPKGINYQWEIQESNCRMTFQKIPATCSTKEATLISNFIGPAFILARNVKHDI